MSIGPDIKEVLQELGVSFTILRATGNVTGERLDYDPNSQVTKPFIREHFLETTFQYDTVVEAGDTIQFDTDGRKFIIVHLDPELFENTVIEYAGVLYKANKYVTIQRPSGEIVNYTTVTHWNEVKSNLPVVLTDKEYASRLDDEDQEVSQMDLKGLVMFAPLSTGIFPHDRVLVSGENYISADSGREHYKVSHVEPHSFKNVVKVFLEEDTRP